MADAGTLAIGDEHALTVTGWADGPDAVARLGGRVVFVFGALPGEKVRARITAVERRFARAELLEVLAPAAGRAEPPCPVFGACGGCHLQHAAYGVQVTAKEARLRFHLERALPGLALPIRPMLRPADPWTQRTKVVLHVGRHEGAPACGFFRRESHAVVPVDACPAADRRAVDLARAAFAAAGRHGVAGLLATVTARVAAGAVHLLAGASRIRDVVAGVELLVSPGAFFQTSAFGAQALVETVRTFAAPAAGGAVLDLHSGVGLLALALAPGARSVLGIETDPASVADARAAAALAGHARARFVAADAETWLRAATDRFDLVVLDPPRAGCAPSLLDALLHLRPPHVVYVSCNPHALARDLAILTRAGYLLRALQPIDMFPHTHHVEAVAGLEVN
jgi:23S rRNA (uracil1939-C5)-methyltransferase